MKVYAYHNDQVIASYSLSRLDKFVDDLKLCYPELLPIVIKDESGAIVKTIPLQNTPPRLERPHEVVAEFYVDQFGFITALF